MKKLKILFLLVLLTGFLKVNNSSAQDNGSSTSGSSVFIEQIENQPNPGIDHKFSKKLPNNIQIQQTLALQALSEIANENGDFNNIAIINQFGKNNQATLNQQGSKNTGVIQIGGPNNSVSDNRVTINQTGIQLTAIADVQGNSNTLNFDQNGQNVGAQFILQGNGLDFGAVQNGPNLQIQPRNSTIPAINITSTRQTVPVIISNN